MLDEHTQRWLRHYLVVARLYTRPSNESPAFATKCHNVINATTCAMDTQCMDDFLHAERAYVTMVEHMDPDPDLDEYE